MKIFFQEIVRNAIGFVMNVKLAQIIAYHATTKNIL